MQLIVDFDFKILSKIKYPFWAQAVYSKTGIAFAAPLREFWLV